MLRSLLALAVAVLSAPVAGQTTPPLRARSFYFDDFRTIVQLDVRALRETGVWDEIYASGIKLTLSMVQEQFGFDVDALDRLTMTGGLVPTDEGPHAFGSVTVLEGNDELGRPSDLDSGAYEVVEVGGHRVYSARWGGDAFVAPSPRLQVYGEPALLRPVLEGRPRSGLPSPDVMAFTAGKQGTLLQWVLDLEQDRELLGQLGELMKTELDGLTWPDGDAPTTLAGRVAATGDDYDPHVLLEVVLRHGTAGAGLERSEAAGRAALAALRKLPQARLFWPLMERVEYERSGTDATWRVDLGRARNVGGLLTSVSPLLFLGFSTVRVVQQAAAQQVIEVVEDEVEPPPPAKKPPPPPLPKKPEKPAGGGG